MKGTNIFPTNVYIPGGNDIKTESLNLNYKSSGGGLPLLALPYTS